MYSILSNGSLNNAHTHTHTILKCRATNGDGGGTAEGKLFNVQNLQLLDFIGNVYRVIHCKAQEYFSVFCCYEKTNDDRDDKGGRHRSLHLS